MRGVVEDVDGEVAVERLPSVCADGVDAAGRAVGDVVEGRVGVEHGEPEAGAVAEVHADVWRERDCAALLDAGDGLRAQKERACAVEEHNLHAVVLPVYHFDADRAWRLLRGVDAAAGDVAHARRMRVLYT